MKYNCSILTILIVATICFLQVSSEQQAVAADEPNKPQLTIPEPAVASPNDTNAPAPVKGGPKITFESVVHDFGNIEPGTKNSCEFKFTNTGDKPLKINEVTKSCGCTTSALEKNEYAPGESGTLQVAYNAAMQPTTVNKTLYVLSNDEVHPKVELTLKGVIVAKIDYQPKKIDLVFNKENAGCPEITIKSLDGKPFAIKKFTAVVEPRPVENIITADFNSSAEANEFVLHPKVDVEKLQGESGGRIEIPTSHPGTAAIIIPFEVLSKFKITPPSIIVYKAEPGKPATREVWILSNYNEDFDIESTSSLEGTIKVLSQEKVDNRYKLELEITPPAAEKGRRGFFTDKFFVNIKGGEKLEIVCRVFYLNEAKKSLPVIENPPSSAEKSPDNIKNSPSVPEKSPPDKEKTPSTY